MGAIYGIVGEASPAELEAMGRAMPSRGACVRHWSPATGVYFGQVSAATTTDGQQGPLAATLQLDLDYPADIQDAQTRDAYARSVVLDALQHDRLGELCGLFAIAWWDERNRRLLLTTDRPNYYSIYFVELRERFAFATDYKALLALEDCPAEPDRDALQWVLATRHAALDRCNLAGVGCLRQRAVLVRRHGVIERQPAATHDTSVIPGSLATLSSRLRDTLLSVVARQTRDTAHIAITLGAGLDSAGVVALVRAVRPELPISTYTIGFGDDDPEIQGARRTAEIFATDHHELIFDPVTVEADLPEMIWLTEQYSGGEEMLLQYQIESYLGQRTSLVASGQGADLIFGGMPRHRLIALADRMPCLRGALLELYQQTQTRIRPSSVAGRALSLVQYRGSALDPLRVLGSSGLARVAEPASLRQFIATTHADLTSHGSFYDNVKVSPILPFMSDAVVRASLRIPARFKSTPFRQKIVLRKALEPLLPEAVRNRPKAIQKVRHDDRLTEVLSAMADRWLEPGRVAERGLLEPADVRSVRQLPALAVYRSDRLYRLWSMLSLEVWCTIFLDQRGRRIPRDGHR